MNFLPFFECFLIFVSHDSVLFLPVIDIDFLHCILLSQSSNNLGLVASHVMIMSSYHHMIIKLPNDDSVIIKLPYDDHMIMSSYDNHLTIPTCDDHRITAVVSIGAIIHRLRCTLSHHSHDWHVVHLSDENYLGENELGENYLGENDLGENDLGVNDLGENDLGENDLDDKDLGENDLNENDMSRMHLSDANASEADDKEKKAKRMSSVRMAKFCHAQCWTCIVVGVSLRQVAVAASGRCVVAILMI